MKSQNPVRFCARPACKKARMYPLTCRTCPWHLQARLAHSSDSGQTPVRLRSGSDLAPVGARLASSLKELRAGGDMGAMRQLLDEQAS